MFIVSEFTFSYAESRASGYDLRITNLASVQIDFELEFRFTKYSFSGDDASQNEIANLAWLMGPLLKDARGYYRLETLTIGPNKAERYGEWVTLHRRSWRALVWGYTILRVPVIRSPTPPYDLVPQTTSPVPVLLEATHVDLTDTPASSGTITFTNTPWTLSTGKSYNEIPPETQPYSRQISAAQYINGLTRFDLKNAPSKGAVGMPEEDRAQALIDLLRQVNSDKEDIDAINKMLSDSETPVRVTALPSDK